MQLVSMLVAAEGKIVAGHNAAQFRDKFKSDSIARIEVLPILLQYQVVVLQLESGSRLIFLGREVGSGHLLAIQPVVILLQVDTSSPAGVRMAIVEIWALGLADLLVVTGQSIAIAWNPLAWCRIVFVCRGLP